MITKAQLHDGPVHSVAYRPDGKGTLFSAGADGELKLRVHTGQRHSVKAHNGVVFQAGYSASGQKIFSLGSDRKVKLWEAPETGFRQTGELDGHLRYVLAGDMSTDETTLATAGGDKAINIWDVSSKTLKRRLEGHTSDVEAIAFTGDGKILISASEDKSVRIWSMEEGTELVRLFFKRSSEDVFGVTFDNHSFGVLDDKFYSVFVDGRQVFGKEAERVLPYLGPGVSIVPN